MTPCLPVAGGLPTLCWLSLAHLARHQSAAPQAFRAMSLGRHTNGWALLKTLVAQVFASAPYAAHATFAVGPRRPANGPPGPRFLSPLRRRPSRLWWARRTVESERDSESSRPRGPRGLAAAGTLGNDTWAAARADSSSRAGVFTPLPSPTAAFAAPAARAIGNHRAPRQGASAAGGQNGDPGQGWDAVRAAAGGGRHLVARDCRKAVWPHRRAVQESGRRLHAGLVNQEPTGRQVRTAMLVPEGLVPPWDGVPHSSQKGEADLLSPGPLLFFPSNPKRAHGLHRVCRSTRGAEKSAATGSP